jgi:hypothetical protein
LSTQIIRIKQEQVSDTLALLKTQLEREIQQIITAGETLEQNKIQLESDMETERRTIQRLLYSRQGAQALSLSQLHQRRSHLARVIQDQKNIFALLNRFVECALEGDMRVSNFAEKQRESFDAEVRAAFLPPTFPVDKDVDEGEKAEEVSECDEGEGEEHSNTSLDGETPSVRDEILEPVAPTVLGNYKDLFQAKDALPRNEEKEKSHDQELQNSKHENPFSENEEKEQSHELELQDSKHKEPNENPILAAELARIQKQPQDERAAQQARKAEQDKLEAAEILRLGQEREQAVQAELARLSGLKQQENLLQPEIAAQAEAKRLEKEVEDKRLAAEKQKQDLVKELQDRIARNEQEMKDMQKEQKLRDEAHAAQLREAEHEISRSRISRAGSISLSKSSLGRSRGHSPSGIPTHSVGHSRNVSTSDNDQQRIQDRARDRRRSELMDVQAVVSTGTVFTKYPSSQFSKPSQTFVRIDDNFTCVAWADRERNISFDVKNKKRISFAEVLSIKLGCTTKPFQRAASSTQPLLCFSIVAINRSLDLMAPNQEALMCWVKFFQGLSQERGPHLAPQ